MIWETRTGAIKWLIEWINNRVARAARALVHIFDVLCKRSPLIPSLEVRNLREAVIAESITLKFFLLRAGCVPSSFFLIQPMMWCQYSEEDKNKLTALYVGIILEQSTEKWHRQMTFISFKVVKDQFRYQQQYFINFKIYCNNPVQPAGRRANWDWLRF